MEDAIKRLHSERQQAIGYMSQKVMREDWDAVVSTAMDLKSIDSKLGILQNVAGPIQQLQRENQLLKDAMKVKSKEASAKDPKLAEKVAAADKVPQATNAPAPAPAADEQVLPEAEAPAAAEAPAPL